MIDITEYLENIYENFCNLSNGENYLCELKKLDFQAGNLPDYTNISIQQLYLLRYAFAYAFEYSYMYKEILPKMVGKELIKVTSIGCGTMIDYWALAYCINNKLHRIRYTGIDEIDWNYKFTHRENDEMHFLMGNVKDFFNKTEKFTSDIYFFPKSISEFNSDEMNTICESFANKNIEKDKIYLCISLRCDPGSMDRDINKTKSIVEALKKNGFKGNCSYDRYTYFNEDRGIAAYDNEFVYPEDALNYIKTLNTRCKQFFEIGQNCNMDCKQKLNRWPTLKTGKICYQIIEFERM